MELIVERNEIMCSRLSPEVLLRSLLAGRLVQKEHRRDSSLLVAKGTVRYSIYALSEPLTGAN